MNRSTLRKCCRTCEWLLRSAAPAYKQLNTTLVCVCMKRIAEALLTVCIGRPEWFTAVTDGLVWCTCCRCYITPKLYLDLLQQYSMLLNTARTELGDNRRRLLNGIAKLAETNSALDSMQSQLNSLQPLLLEKTATTSALLKQVKVHWHYVCSCQHMYGAVCLEHSRKP